MLEFKRSTHGGLRRDRLELSLSATQRALIQRAAELEGCSVTEYVALSVQDAAKRTIEQHETIVLSAKDSRAFVEAMLNPSPIPERLKESVRRYRAVRGE